MSVTSLSCVINAGQRTPPGRANSELERANVPICGRRIARPFEGAYSPPTGKGFQKAVQRKLAPSPFGGSALSRSLLAYMMAFWLVCAEASRCDLLGPSAKATCSQQRMNICPYDLPSAECRPWGVCCGFSVEQYRELADAPRQNALGQFGGDCAAMEGARNTTLPVATMELAGATTGPSGRTLHTCGTTGEAVQCAAPVVAAHPCAACKAPCNHDWSGTTGAAARCAAPFVAARFCADYYAPSYLVLPLQRTDSELGAQNAMTTQGELTPPDDNPKTRRRMQRSSGAGKCVAALERGILPLRTVCIPAIRTPPCNLLLRRDDGFDSGAMYRLQRAPAASARPLLNFSLWQAIAPVMAQRALAMRMPVGGIAAQCVQGKRPTHDGTQAGASLPANGGRLVLDRPP